MAVQEPTCSPDDREYFEEFFQDLSSSSDKVSSVSDPPRNLRSKFIENLASTVSENRSHNTGDRVCKFKFSEPSNRKWRGTTSAKTPFTAHKDNKKNLKKLEGTYKNQN